MTPLRRIFLVAGVVFACVLPLVGQASTATAVPASSADAQLDKALAALVRMPGGPPGVVAVVQRGNNRQVFEHGVADKATGATINQLDRWRIGSVSKAFSGAAALSLVAQGKLSLSDTIASRLPQLPAAWGSVTLAQALQHVSGLPDYSVSPGFQHQLGTDPRLPMMPAQLISFVAGQPLDFAPGTAYHYSNTDVSYERALDELVLDPLALRSTSMPLGYRMVNPFVHGYDNNVNGKRDDLSEVFNMSVVWAAGGMASTPLDLTRFVRAYGGGKLFGGATRAAQLNFRPGGGSDPPGPGTNAAGLGIFRYQTSCGTVYGHTGNLPGYTTFIATSPNGSRSITINANTQLDWDPLLNTKQGSHAAFDALRHTFELGVCAALAGK
jgi:D-alanyl-D-alanine carboxypeptidase